MGFLDGIRQHAALTPEKRREGKQYADFLDGIAQHTGLSPEHALQRIYCFMHGRGRIEALNPADLQSFLSPVFDGDIYFSDPSAVNAEDYDKQMTDNLSNDMESYRKEWHIPIWLREFVAAYYANRHDMIGMEENPRGGNG